MSNLATSVKETERLGDPARHGPQLIFAGRGGHPRRTLLACAIDLIENHGADPESLLVVTPTDKAARELTTRLRRAINAQGIHFNPNAIYAGTFLALCLRVLEENRNQTQLKRNITVMDAFDQHYFLYQRLDDYLALKNSALVLGSQGTRWSQAQTLLKQINAVTEQALDAKGLLAARPRAGRALSACYQLYLQQLEKANALDAATAQLAALRLLEENGPVLATLKRQIAYLIIDAQQETSIIKERILACFIDPRSLPCLADNEHLARARPPAARNVVEFPPLPPRSSAPKEPGRTASGDGVPWWLR